MKQNVGGIDRILRIVVGVALIAWDLLINPAPIWWPTAIGAVLLFTGLISWCPAYLPFGFSSKK